MRPPGTRDTLLFDLFGVIARQQSAAGRAELETAAGIEPDGGDGFWEAYWALRPPYDSGAMTAPAYWQAVAARLGTVFTERRTARLTEADIASWSHVDGEMVALLGELSAQGRELALLSNIPHELAAHYDAHHRSWLDHFAVRAYSCRIGHAKPRPEAYAWCLRALGREAAPERVLFVDDRAENVRAAESAGLRGQLFTGPGELRENLARDGR